MLSWTRRYNPHQIMLRDVVIYSVGAVMLRNNAEIVCVVSQVSNRANNENMRDESRRRKWKIHTVRDSEAVIESEAVRDGEEVGKIRDSSIPAPKLK